MKVIEVLVTKAGNTRVETKGFHGDECQQASRFLEMALGNRVRETLTVEFHENANEPTHVTESD